MNNKKPKILMHELMQEMTKDVQADKLKVLKKYRL